MDYRPVLEPIFSPSLVGRELEGGLFLVILNSIQNLSSGLTWTVR